MKAVSFCEPYATLVALGIKGIETRTLKPPPGPVAVHISKRPNAALLAHCFTPTINTSGEKDYLLRDNFRELLSPYGYHTLSDFNNKGKVIGTMEIKDWFQVPKNYGEKEAEHYARQHISRFIHSIDEGAISLEYMLGGYGAGRYGWNITAFNAFAVPIPCAGQLGIWNFAPEGSHLIEMKSSYER